MVNVIDEIHELKESDLELYEQARRRVQNKLKGRCVRNKDVIIDQEKEIEYYRDEILKLRKLVEDKTINKSIDNMNIKINLEAEETINKLKQINCLLKDIKESQLKIGVDFGQDKDYTTEQLYIDGKLVREITQYK